MGEPAYLRIAADLRALIADGTLGPGDRVPSQTTLRNQYGVSMPVAAAALDRLAADGLIERRQGSGSFVKETRRIQRRTHSRNMRTMPGPSGSPFARDAAAAGRRGHWEHHSEQTTATPRIAERLQLTVGDPVMRTRYRYFAGDEPIQLAESHEPLTVTGGTPIEWPEDGPVVGVVARMDTIGVHIDRAEERITCRPAMPDEAEQLGMSSRASIWVMVIERTYFVGDRPVEFADIVFPGDRYEIVCDTPIDPA